MDDVDTVGGDKGMSEGVAIKKIHPMDVFRLLDSFKIVEKHMASEPLDGPEIVIKGQGYQSDASAPRMTEEEFACLRS